MKRRGFFGIGCENMKDPFNYGSLFRTAQIFNADFLFIIGKRFEKQSSDTCKSWKHIPTYQYNSFDEFYNHLPYNSKLVGIELDPKAKPLFNYYHPKNGVYLLGAENHGLSKNAINKCQDIVVLPGDYSLNVSIAGSIVLYDRICKDVSRETIS